MANALIADHAAARRVAARGGGARRRRRVSGGRMHAGAGDDVVAEARLGSPRTARSAGPAASSRSTLTRVESETPSPLRTRLEHQVAGQVGDVLLARRRSRRGRAARPTSRWCRAPAARAGRGCRGARRSGGRRSATARRRGRRWSGRAARPRARASRRGRSGSPRRCRRARARRPAAVGFEHQLDLGVLVAEVGEPRHQPAHREGRGGGDLQRAPARRRRSARRRRGGCRGRRRRARRRAARPPGSARRGGRRGGSSGTPSRSSSARTCWLTAAWLTFSAAPAG